MLLGKLTAFFVNKSSVYTCGNKFMLKSASQPNDPSKKAIIKICKVDNTHFVPSRLKSSGVVRYQKKKMKMNQRH